MKKEHLIAAICHAFGVEVPQCETLFTFTLNSNGDKLEVTVKPEAGEVVLFCAYEHVGAGMKDIPNLRLDTRETLVVAHWGDTLTVEAVEVGNLWMAHRMGRGLFEVPETYDLVLLALDIGSPVVSLYPHIRRAA